MRSQGVRALPSFHFWKNQKLLDSISGAKAQVPFTPTPELGSEPHPEVSMAANKSSRRSR
eukprot:1752944-Pleurochrysis_carterae.AAC.6